MDVARYPEYLLCPLLHDLLYVHLALEGPEPGLLHTDLTRITLMVSHLEGGQ